MGESGWLEAGLDGSLAAHELSEVVAVRLEFDPRHTPAAAAGFDDDCGGGWPGGGD